MPNIDLSILNQRQTPAFYADILANRPAAGFIGRIFVSTNTFAFFRDNGTGWDLIGGPGTGTVTGSGAAGQVSFWDGANTITGNNDLFWDNVNGHLGIGTNVPGTALQIDHDQSQIIRLNQTTATNDTKIAFQNSGTALWRIGNSYNAGANDFGIFDVVGAFQPVTVKKTTGQVLIGTSTVGSGKLVVASSTGDNGVQIVGASAPSLRLDNAESGPTKRAGFGISTATNNFIQGSADRDFCMFNGSTTASPILFGIYDTTNVQEAARISAARNLLVGTTTDGGQKLQVNGGARATGYYLDGMTAGNGALYYSAATNRVTLANYNVGGILNFEVNGGNSAMTIDANGQLGLGVTPSAWSTVLKAFDIGTSGSLVSSASGAGGLSIARNAFYNGSAWIYKNTSTAQFYEQDAGSHIWYNAPSGTAGNAISFTPAMTLSSSSNLLIGTTTDAGQKLQVNGTSLFTGNLSATGLRLNGSDTANTIYAGSSNMAITAETGYNISIGRASDVTRSININTTNGYLLIGTTTVGSSKLKIVGLPTSAVGLSSGDVYSNAGILTIVP